MTGRLPLPIGTGAAERARRIDELARLVAAGRYRVPAERVADAILAAVQARRTKG